MLTSFACPGHRLPDPSPKGLKCTQALRSRSYPFSNQSQTSSKPDRKPKPTPHTQNLSWTHCPPRVNLTRCRITLTDFNKLPTPHTSHPNHLKTTYKYEDMYWERRLWVVSFSLCKELKIFIVPLTVNIF